MSDLDEIRDELFLMVALTPDETGLPMAVWASPSYNAPHDIRIKARLAHGARVDPANLTTVALHPTPRVPPGQRPLPAADLRAITAWWRLNEAALLGYWEGRLNTTQFMQQLRPLSPPIPKRPVMIRVLVSRHKYYACDVKYVVENLRRCWKCTVDEKIRSPSHITIEIHCDPDYAAPLTIYLSSMNLI